MFKLLYFKVSNHPQLENLEINFIEEDEIQIAEKPFTSVIIGPNGTGKSFILRTIIEIFRYFFDLSKNDKKGNLPYNFHLRYKINDDLYDIVTRKLAIGTKTGLRRSYIYFKNRPSDLSIFGNGEKTLFESLPQYEIVFADLVFPERILASSVFLNDRFPFAESADNDFYQYLGVRRTAIIASTRTFAKKTIKYLFEASNSPNFRALLAEILDFLNFEKHLKVQYNTRYNHLFFNGKLTVDKFEAFYERWWELKDIGVKRKKTNAPWGQGRYNYLKKNNPERIGQIVNFLNESSTNPVALTHKYRSKSKVFTVDFFTSNYDQQEFPFVEELEKLSIITQDKIRILKKEIEISIEETSSGEYHLILGLLGIFAKIKPKSLVLIDEPEISLHPNWQMRYIDFLKKMFKLYSGCHFIIATHSHFLISDLEGLSSSVNSITRDERNNGLISEYITSNTYGWSAEEVLLKIFKTPTSRNYYLAEKLDEIFKLISKEPTEKRIIKIKSKVGQLRTLDLTGLSKEDPLVDVINILYKQFN